ncbi:putative ribonuclease H-like domain-containing protein [Tanacetum coccineum]
MVGFTPRRGMGFFMELVQGATPICEGSCHLTPLRGTSCWNDCKSCKVRVGSNGNSLWEASVLLGRKKVKNIFRMRNGDVEVCGYAFWANQYTSGFHGVNEQGREGVREFFQQHGSEAKRKLSRGGRNQMGNEPVIALPEGADDFIVYYDARSKDLEVYLVEERGRLLSRWMKLFNEYGFEAKYHLGKANVVVESWSRKKSEAKNKSGLTYAIQARSRWMLQKIVSQMAMLGENISQEDLNLKFLRSLPSKWNTHVMVWRNKPDLDTMSSDDIYNNFNIVKQEVKRTASSSPANTQVSPASTQVSIASSQDLEQIHKDDIEEMDLKWQLALLSMRTRRFFQKTGRKITINGSDIAGYDKSKNQDSSRRTINMEKTSSKAMVAIVGAGFDWSYMADDEVPINMALMAFSDSMVHNDKTCSKTCLKSFETLKTQLDDLRIEFNKSEFNLATYKRGFTSILEQLVFYKKNKVFFEQLAVLKRDISYKDLEISMHKSELEKLKQEKESNQLKIENFDNASKSLDKLIGSQITDKIRKGMGVIHKKKIKAMLTCECSLGHTDREMSISQTFKDCVRGYVTFMGGAKGGKITKTLVDKKVKIIRCDNGTEFKNRVMSEFCEKKGIKKEFSVARTPYQNSVAERRNKTLIEAAKTMRHGSSQDYILMPLWKDGSLSNSSLKNAKRSKNSTQDVNTVGPSINTASTNINTGCLNINIVSPTVTTAPVEAIHADFFSDETEVDMSNITTTYPVPSTPNIRIHKDHSLDHVIGDVQSGVQTRRMTKTIFEQGIIRRAQKRLIQALKDPSWIEAIQEELLQFKLQQVWALIDLPHGKRAIGTKWVYRNKKDEKDSVIRNKARQVTQGYTQEEGIYYDEVFALVAKDEAIRLFLAYASFKDFVVLPQRDVKSANFCMNNGPLYGYVKLLDLVKSDILLVQVYVDDIIFGSTKKELCTEFKKLMHKKFQMSSMGELTFFLGLQVTQKDDGIFISQDKYVDEILKKFGFSTIKTASTPMETLKPLMKDENAEDVDVHLYRSMIGSLMYLTSSRHIIMFVVCACIRFQVTPKVLHLHAVKRIFRYLKGQPKLGLWYPKDSPFDLEAYTDSDYAGASLDRKSTTGGCQFLRSRLISWQCKKQTIVSNSTTEEEYVAAASCCGQGLVVQGEGLTHPPRSPTQSPVADEAAYTGVNARYGGATTTVTGLEAGEGCGNIDKTPTTPHDSPFIRVNTLGSDEGSMTLQELMVFCTTLSKKVESLETDLKSFYVEEWDDIQARVEADEELAQSEKGVLLHKELKKGGISYLHRLNRGPICLITSSKWEVITAQSEVDMRVPGVSSWKFKKGCRRRTGLESIRKYWKIIRVRNHTEVHQLFDDMLKALDRDDLVMLWSLVKENFKSTELTVDKEREIWVELKRLFEPDTDDELWKLQKHIHDLTWRLYDSCGVHYVFTEKGIDIYMLVEKEYPLSRGTLTQMLAAKLLVEQDNEMSRELLRKIFMQG